MDRSLKILSTTPRKYPSRSVSLLSESDFKKKYLIAPNVKLWLNTSSTECFAQNILRSLDGRTSSMTRSILSAEFVLLINNKSNVIMSLKSLRMSKISFSSVVSLSITLFLSDTIFSVLAKIFITSSLTKFSLKINFGIML